MPKTNKKSRSLSLRSISKSVKSTTKKTLPVINKGLNDVGTATEQFARKSIPVVEKGVATVYNAMSSGLDLGIKGAKTVSKSVTSARRSSKSRRTRRRSRR